MVGIFEIVIVLLVLLVIVAVPLGIVLFVMTASRRSRNGSAGPLSSGAPPVPCGKCGTLVDPQDTFCRRCGARLDASSAV